MRSKNILKNYNIIIEDSLNETFSEGFLGNFRRREIFSTGIFFHQQSLNQV